MFRKRTFTLLKLNRRTSFLTKYDLHIRKDDLQNTSFRNNLKNYITDHKYSLAAVKIYGNHDLEELEVSETFSETTFWRFALYRVKENVGNSHCLEETVKYLGTRSSTMFSRGYDAIERYLKTKGGLQNSQEDTAFRALKKFYVNKEEHENRLMMLKDLSSEEQVAAVISQHLICQLLPFPSSYFMDNIHTKGPTDKCPCGCGQPLNFGSTLLGSPHLFHGFVDGVLIPAENHSITEENYTKSAVFTARKKTDDIYYHCLVNKEWMDKYESTVYKLDEEILNREYKSEINVIDEKQLCKQAIAMSLCKYQEQSNKKDSSYAPAMPVFGMTSDSFEVAVYDPVHDYLLKSNKPLNFFEEDSQNLKFSSVVDLWLLIYHSLFFTTPSPRVVHQLRGTANLIPQLGEKRFEKIVKSSRWMFLPYFHHQSFPEIHEGVIKYVDRKEDASGYKH
ncbi:uncharacterized protein LOC133181073 [Saccostrea echinata]|uniref:uncharacterized protein LOC133181073 n=1 Tax=Saccostrea echinata TaxID=191078 RepID=UPI002A80E7C6|nr:uncharacterized protein LOC133181073 [Saccostrea echinata]